MRSRKPPARVVAWREMGRGSRTADFVDVQENAGVVVTAVSGTGLYEPATVTTSGRVYTVRDAKWDEDDVTTNEASFDFEVT